LWARVAGSNLNDQAGELAFNRNGVLFVAAQLNNSDGYLVHTLDATGNFTFPQPQLAALSPFSTCFASPWVETATRTALFTVTQNVTFTQLVTITQRVSLTQQNTLLSLVQANTPIVTVAVTATDQSGAVNNNNNIASSNVSSETVLLVGIGLASGCVLLTVGALVVVTLRRKKDGERQPFINRTTTIPISQSFYGETVQRNASLTGEVDKYLLTSGNTVINNQPYTVTSL
jgi:hypothetical protein